MKCNTPRWSLVALFATLAGVPLAANAQTSATPTNNQLLDKLIAGANPGSNFVQSGDMLLSVDALKAYRQAQDGGFSGASAFYHTTLWPGGRVPYVFDPAFPDDSRTYFVAACREWEKWANLKFVPRTTETDYIRIYRDPSDGSFSNVGKTGGQQDLSLASWANEFTACHELAHALGVMHEQNRSDRDTYVTIDFSNIIADKQDQYAIVSDSNNLGTYDFDSVMHYPAISGFNIDTSKPAIICKDGYTQYQNTIGQRDHLSLLDKNGMAIMYGAPVAATNDNFADAITITGTSGKVTGTTSGATRETGEPVHVTGVASTASIWYKWTPTATGTATFATSGSNYDTLLAVYTGTSLSHLTKVVSNDDATATVKTSALSFEPKVGTTYYIAVDGYFNATGGQTTGNVALAWKQVLPILRYTVSGVVKDGTGNPLSGVSITLSGATVLQTTTSATGAYSFDNQPAGNYTIQPSKTNYSFSPSFLALQLSAASPANDFVGTAKVVVPSTATQIFVSDVNVREGNQGKPYASFTISLNKPSSSPVTVDFATADGTALSESDYVSRTGTITFPANTVTVPLTIYLVPDSFTEQNEIFYLNLSNASGATIGDAQGRAIITNDDGTGFQFLPRMSVSDVTMREGNAGNAFVTFNVTLNKPSDTAITATFSTADGSATSGSDYVARTGTITFAPNTVTGTVKVSLLPDTTAEANETFTLNLSNPNGATIVDAQGQATLYNDDGTVAGDAAPAEAAPASSSPSARSARAPQANPVRGRLRLAMASVTR